MTHRPNPFVCSKDTGPVSTGVPNVHRVLGGSTCFVPGATVTDFEEGSWGHVCVRKDSRYHLLNGFSGSVVSRGGPK